MIPSKARPDVAGEVERRILAAAYRDDGQDSAARYIEAGHDLTPDTPIALIAIRAALRRDRP